MDGKINVDVRKILHSFTCEITTETYDTKTMDR